MLKMLIPYGIKKVFTILVGIPIKLFLLLQALNPLTWMRLSRKIHESPPDVDENGEPVEGYDPLRPPPPTEKQVAAWHLSDEKRNALMERVHLGQKLMLLLFIVIPTLFALTIWKGWGSSTFSTPLLTFNFSILVCASASLFLPTSQTLSLSFSLKRISFSIHYAQQLALQTLHGWLCQLPYPKPPSLPP